MITQRKKEPMRIAYLLLTFVLLLTACAAPAKDAPIAPQAEPPVEIEPTSESVESTPESAASAKFEESLLIVEWKGSSEGNVLFPLDPASGDALPNYMPISLGQTYSYAFSPDRQKLAAVTFPNDNTYNGSLLIIDLPHWKTETFELKTVGWVTSMVFSPDGTQLAIAQGESNYVLTLFDLAQGVFTAQSKEDSYITRLKFTADGESLMMYGITIQNRYTENETGGAPQVGLLNTADLSPRWSAELKDVRDGVYPANENIPVDFSQPGTAIHLAPALAFAPEQDSLYVVHADSDHLTTVDFSAQTIQTVVIQEQLSWFERLLSLTAGVAHAKVSDGSSKQAVISPDGKLLYVVGLKYESFLDKMGNWQMNQTPFGLEILHTSDGSRVERFETVASDLSISTDGQLLYLRNWTDKAPWTKVFDLSTKQIIAHKEWIYAALALRMNGAPLLVSTHATGEYSHHMSILTPDGSQVLSEWTSSGYITPITP